MKQSSRQRVSTASPFEPKVGISRAVRSGNIIAVTGTAPLGPDGKTVARGDPAAQARNPSDEVPQAMAGKVQYRGHEPNYKSIRRLASGLWDSHACGSQVGNVYRTQVNVFRAPSGFIVAITYSKSKRVCEGRAGSGQLRTRNSWEGSC